MFGINRVRFVFGLADVRDVMLKKGLISLNRVKQIWADCSVAGNGKTGQVRKASFGSRSITLLDTKLNRGSVIDFINSVVEKNNNTFLAKSLTKLNKGNFLFGGSSDKEITDLFEKVCKLVEDNKISLKNLGQEAVAPVRNFDLGSYMGVSP
jgi:hypothetical protein